MKARVLVGVIGVPFLLVVLVWAPAWATMILVAAMCAVGAYELLHAVSGGRRIRLLLTTVAVAILINPCIYLESMQRDMVWSWAVIPTFPVWYFLALVFVVVLFCSSIFRYGKKTAIPFSDLTAAIFAGLVFPLMLSCLLRLRLMENGALWVFVPLAISFGSDTFALFAGMLFGRHKLAPHVSPKKTVEGAVGGLVGGVVGMLLIKWIGGALTPVHLGYGLAVGMGLLGSVIGQIGDLSFSVVKREFGVKDYGRLLPGHGGVLDRFDSVTFVAPVAYLLLSLGLF